MNESYNSVNGQQRTEGKVKDRGTRSRVNVSKIIVATRLTIEVKGTLNCVVEAVLVNESASKWRGNEKIVLHNKRC